MLILWIEQFFWKNVSFPSFIGRPSIIIGRSRISIGHRVRILPFARIEAGESGNISIADNVSIGPSVNITSQGSIVIESGCTISANVFITDSDHTFEHPNISTMQQPNKSTHTIIERNCFIGANSVILAGTVLKKGTIVGANSTVRGVYGPGQTIAGSPARAIKS